MLDRAAAPYILALDVATSTGTCEGFAGAIPRFSTLRFASDGDEHEDAFARSLRWIAERLAQPVAIIPRPDVVYIEAPLRLGAAWGKTNADTILRLNGLWAVLSAAVKTKGIKYRRATVQDCRLAFIGHGNLKGPEAKRRAFAMCKALGWNPKDRDQSDAGCLWFYACTREALNLAPIITPMLQSKISVRIGGVDMGDNPELLKRAGVR